MSAQIKHLVFKGISKKEQILFKSFLNLAKNELDYEVVILKDDAQSDDTPDIVILDEAYDMSEQEADLSSLATIVVGDKLDGESPNYITRPAQWSDFKSAFTSLDIDAEEVEEQPVDRVLPNEVKFAIADMVEETVEVSDSGDTEGFSDEEEYDYELDHMSVDYHSFTNSEYMKVVDDVQQFNDGTSPETKEPVILVTDDESASANSVLVIETNSLDAWDFSDAEMTSEASVSDFKFSQEEAESSQQEDTPQTSSKKTKSGLELKPKEQYWLEDTEIIVENRSVLFIKADRRMVYSDCEPAKWLSFLQHSKLSKLPLSVQWRPTSNLKVYPLDRLLWANTMVNEGSKLLDGLDEDEEYILERWPHFELLELDNILLKLCSMLFVRPESVDSLAKKSGYGRSTIRGLVNACHEFGILKTPKEVNIRKLPAANSDDSMLGKIKDVFR